MQICLQRFSKDIVHVKGAKLLNKVDMERDRRMESMNDFLDIMKKILQQQRLLKIRDRYKQKEVGKICAEVFFQIDHLFVGCNYK